ncbi:MULTISPECIES: hypothetical protein [Methylomonas]|uniref:hypothetical protein n=1 Tax=Methylomonas TaxID=416 RepID=UPI001232863B|nr:hypothetical protein [Methylomonas rhizoryzae]
MKAYDFICSCWFRLLVFMAALSLASPIVAAEDYATDDANASEKLVLTLSDKWLASEAPNGRFRQNGSSDNASVLLPEKSDTRPADIGCGMDLNPSTVGGTSLSSRVVGACNFNYHY